MKENIKNVLCFVTIFIVLLLCSAISFLTIAYEPLCGYEILELKEDLAIWLIMYSCVCLTIIVVSIMIQLLLAKRIMTKSIDLVCDHTKKLTKRELACRKTAMDCIAGSHIDWNAINKRDAQWNKEDEEYEKMYKQYQEEYKYFSYFWDNENED